MAAAKVFAQPKKAKRIVLPSNLRQPSLTFPWLLEKGPTCFERNSPSWFRIGSRVDNRPWTLSYSTDPATIIIDASFSGSAIDSCTTLLLQTTPQISCKSGDIEGTVKWKDKHTVINAMYLSLRFFFRHEKLLHMDVAHDIHIIASFSDINLHGGSYFFDQLKNDWLPSVTALTMYIQSMKGTRWNSVEETKHTWDRVFVPANKRNLVGVPHEDQTLYRCHRQDEFSKERATEMP